MKPLARAVLGIDAAWTPTQPSGVALAVEEDGRWRLVTVEASYDRFIARAEGGNSSMAATGSFPDPDMLIDAATRMCGMRPDLVAVDMPLSRQQPITARRCADDAVSRAYGRRKCGTHSPGQVRPGQISSTLQRGFEKAGYPLCTTALTTPGLMEVYPHPALVELMGEPVRLQYKLGKTRAYWPHLPPDARRRQLFDVWTSIIAMLDAGIIGTADALAGEPGTRVADLKSREDMIDAVICCAIAIRALQGEAVAYGDETAAIWIPL